MDNNFIAPVANPKGPIGPNIKNTSNKIVFIIIGLVVAVIISVALLMVSQTNSPAEPLDRLNARMSALQSMIDVGTKNAQGSDLRKIVSDASILMTGDITSVKQATATAGATGKSAAVIAQENESELLEELDSAAIDGQFDSVYTPALIAKYESTIRLLSSTERSGGPALQSALGLARSHCESILKQLQALTI